VSGASALTALRCDRCAANFQLELQQLNADALVQPSREVLDQLLDRAPFARRQPKLAVADPSYPKTCAHPLSTTRTLGPRSDEVQPGNAEAALSDLVESGREAAFSEAIPGPVCSPYRPVDEA
jgi:hypothetical protein